jgi:hypothetical protein
MIIYWNACNRGGQLHQLWELQFRRQQSATAICSMLKFIKSKHGSILTEEHLAELTWTVITTYQTKRSWPFIQNYINQINYFVLKTRTLLKVSCVSHISDMRELHLATPDIRCTCTYLIFYRRLTAGSMARLNGLRAASSLQTMLWRILI